MHSSCTQWNHHHPTTCRLSNALNRTGKYAFGLMIQSRHGQGETGQTRENLQDLMSSWLTLVGVSWMSSRGWGWKVEGDMVRGVGYYLRWNILVNILLTYLSVIYLDTNCSGCDFGRHGTTILLPRVWVWGWGWKVEGDLVREGWHAETIPYGRWCAERRGIRWCQGWVSARPWWG